MSYAVWTGVTGVFRRTALPLASYYVVTLALPLINGAARSDSAFVKHALVVLVVPLAVIVIAYAIGQIVRATLTNQDTGRSPVTKSRPLRRSL
jgi:hypothetical protein